MAWPVFKTAMEAPPAAPVGSIPTRSRHPLLSSAFSDTGAAHRVIPPRLAIVLLLLLAAPRLGAQDTASVPAAAPADTAVGSRVSPMSAFWRSFLLPGWGQARLNRKLTGGIFVAWEGVTLGMSLRTRHELGYLRRTNSARADDKRRQHEDWIVLLAFNHLFAALEGYVSAHLADFPGDLELRAVPGGIGGSISVPFRLR